MLLLEGDPVQAGGIAGCTGGGSGRNGRHIPLLRLDCCSSRCCLSRMWLKIPYIWLTYNSRMNVDVHSADQLPPMQVREFLLRQHRCNPADDRIMHNAHAASKALLQHGRNLPHLSFAQDEFDLAAFQYQPRHTVKL